ncbi:MAG: 4Fe-4S binding protein [Synergistaceae bacterium]|jgi:Fe-S-cluster-containing hydrogenase component 2|nr:4Fe-4S binding protein [Synergistaceae bacterium]
MPPVRKVARVSEECVSCGNCAKVCPLGAISIYLGLFAVVDGDKCVGCGKCERTCPAGVISMTNREAA